MFENSSKAGTDRELVFNEERQKGDGRQFDGHQMRREFETTQPKTGFTLAT